MIVRQKYLDELIAFKDCDLIKVVTGMRRCGKSTLLDMMADHLMRMNVPPERIFMFKMESMEYAGLADYKKLYAKVIEEVAHVEHPYLFFDELQEVLGWEIAINALRVDLECDIYITGSNAYLLSSELSTKLSGRYVEIHMLPLTFEEYLEFKGANWYSKEDRQRDLVTFNDGGFSTLASMLEDYRRFGGLPYLALQETNQAHHKAYMKTLYDTVLIRDIMERDRRRDRRQLKSPELLERIALFLADNIGNENSINKMAGALRAEKMESANNTVAAYIGALCESYLFYPCRRYDIKGKENLKTGGKHYIVDVGIRNYLQGYRDSDQGRVLENIVYLQLLYDGYEASIGKLRAGEVDFVATRDGETLYIQVTEDMSDQSTMERELAPLFAIRDAHPKMVVVAKGSYPTNIDGVKIVKIEDFLLHR